MTGLIALLGGARASIFALLLLVGVPVASLIAYNHGAAKWEDKYGEEVTAHKDTRRANAAVWREFADATAAVAAKAKAASTAYAAARRVNNKQYDKAVDDAKQARSDLVRA